MNDGRSPEPLPPRAVVAIADGRPCRAIWENELGGVTFEIGSDPNRIFVKWIPKHCAIDLAEEVERLAWAIQYTAVPLLIDRGNDDSGSWIVTRALAGESAVSERWMADPATAVRELGRGLRALHDTLPVDGCPFTWSAEDRKQAASLHRSDGFADPARWHPIHQGLSLAEAYAAIADTPPIDQLVVCHGDSCAPNTIVGDNGRWSGHVDLGSLGAADRWADLAVATWSTEWNYGPGWEHPLLDAYGIDPDPRRTQYYRLLWDLGP